MLRVAIQDNLSTGSDTLDQHDIARHAGMGLVGARSTGYDTSREAFIGTYRGYHNPEAVERGACTVSYTHLRAHETVLDLVCRLLLEKKKDKYP